MYSLLALILPVVLSVRSPVDTKVNPVPTILLVLTFPPVMLPVAEINPPVSILPPVIFALTDTVPPSTLPPVTLPVADTTPPVKTLPPVTFAVTETVVPV